MTAKPLALILTTSDLASRLGAHPVPVVTGAATGREIPILSRDGGPVYAWPIQPGTRDSGARL